jgi:hypothetical protein
VATATAVKETVVKETVRIDLSLTNEEAEALLTVLCYVSGDSERSRRGAVKSVLDALRGIDVGTFITDVRAGSDVHFFSSR